MKKLIMFMLILLVFSGLAAAQLKYWTSEVYLQGIPREFSDGRFLTKVATVFTPVDDCTLEGVYFPFYAQGAAGQANVFIAIYPVDAEGLPNMGGLPMASATVRYEDLVDWATAPIGEDYNYVDFSATGLSFGPTAANGSAFAMVMSCPNGSLPSIKTGRHW